MKMRLAALLSALALAGCAAVPIASITDIDQEDVQVLVQYSNLLGAASDADVQAAAAVEASRGCERYGKQATYLSGQVVQRGNQYNSYTTQVRMIFTCN